jgi:RHS repeat-associated protein
VRVISGATTYTYNYLVNGQNLRVRKTGPSSVVPQGTQVFGYDEAGRLIGEYDNYGRARNEHVWLADRPVALIVYTYSGTSTTPLTTTVYSVEADHLGTPRLITDSAQAQRWSWHSAPYGDTQPNQNPASKGTLVYNLRFAGQYYDKETNNFYNWNRDYESTTGRYIQSDPIGLSGGINTYGYVNGNPLLSIDPTGEVPIAPIVYGYAKCMAQCMAFDAASGWLTGGSVQCLDAGELAKSCALDCVNPMNWFGGNKLKAAKAGGRHGGEAHRATVSRRATELQDQGHAVTAGGGLLPERSVITPEGKRRFPDISTIDPSGRPYHENVGRSISSGDPVARERRALDDIERSTGRRPGYTPYDRP